VNSKPSAAVQEKYLEQGHKRSNGVTMSDEQFEPTIIGFLCNWCAYAGADLAGVSRLQYPANLRTIRTLCSATVGPHQILKAFQKGADGVFVGG